MCLTQYKPLTYHTVSHFDLWKCFQVICVQVIMGSSIRILLYMDNWLQCTSPRIRDLSTLPAFGLTVTSEKKILRTEAGLINYQLASWSNINCPIKKFWRKFLCLPITYSQATMCSKLPSLEDHDDSHNLDSISLDFWVSLWKDPKCGKAKCRERSLNIVLLHAQGVPNKRRLVENRERDRDRQRPVTFSLENSVAPNAGVRLEPIG